MGKYADIYLKGDAWNIIEEGFSPDHNEVSESIFSLANEFTGVRGFFDEGSPAVEEAASLRGVYFNGMYEVEKTEGTAYKGIVQHTHFMINAPDWLWTQIWVDGEKVQISRQNTIDFMRILDMRHGKLVRSFVWISKSGKKLRLLFTRILDMENPCYAYQKIEFQPLNFSGEIELISACDAGPIHQGRKKCYWDVIDTNCEATCIMVKTKTTRQKLCINMSWEADFPLAGEDFAGKKTDCALDETCACSSDFNGNCIFGKKFTVSLEEKKISTLVKKVTFAVDKTDSESPEELLQRCLEKGYEQKKITFAQAEYNQSMYWKKIWDHSDIQIEGDDLNQQGIRFCIFQMNQTYHGIEDSDNIGAKGLTGEAYNGHAFWDTETYCLPFYLYSNISAARKLLEFRYSTLDKARERAKMLDCKGACYPVATLNGEEACNLWQHASLQFQPSSGVAYGIAHYYALTGDKDFLYGHGIEMLIEISRFLVSRGAWNQNHSGFGIYAVMGPDEFHMMVNNNAYTNYMCKKTFDFTLNVLRDLQADNPALYKKTIEKTGFTEGEAENLRECSEKMIILFDEKTKLFEQHEGYFSLPHIDVNKIPVEDFPLYGHWSYDRIYRTDMIKQPDVLMLLFLYRSEFSEEILKANYEYYEPKTIHESSLSPSVHSVLACDLKKFDEAQNFFSFATRLDLDNYNRNTREGLHTTSIAAAWINIVFGFGGLHSDPDMNGNLSINPILPASWKSYSFRFVYKDSLVLVNVSRDCLVVSLAEGKTVQLKIYDKNYLISEVPLKIPLKNPLENAK